jgi:quaternary ammonium compound-resistance protein SugE
VVVKVTGRDSDSLLALNVGTQREAPDDGSVPGERKDWPKEPNMHWLVLIASGMLEAVWATALGVSEKFKKTVPTIVFFIAMIASMAGLAYAMREIPTGTAYAVWVGIGAVLTVAIAMIRGEEKATTARILLLLGIVACVIGLKVVA